MGWQLGFSQRLWGVWGSIPALRYIFLRIFRSSKTNSIFSQRINGADNFGTGNHCAKENQGNFSSVGEKINYFLGTACLGRLPGIWLI